MVSLRAHLAGNGTVILSGSRPRWRRWLCLALLWAATRAAAADVEALLNAWLTRQTNIATWSAEFVQTRHLKALTRPLVTPGRVWFRAPNRFRWELGVPARSVAVRTDAELLILSPRLRRAERYPLSAFASGPMGDALALLDTGFPRDAAEFTNRFAVLGLTETNAAYAFRLQPRAKSVQKLLPELTVSVTTNGFRLSATELVFRDGSRLRNDFGAAIENGEVAPERFAPDIGDGWKITEPLEAR